jgi:hypothetical protein
MALLAFNKTNSVVNIVGKTTVALPANGGVLTYGPAVNVTSELKGLTNAQYITLDAFRSGGSVAFLWTTVPEYDVTGLTVGALQTLQVLAVSNTTTTVTGVVESRRLVLLKPLAASTTGAIVTAALPVLNTPMSINANTIDCARKLQVTVVTGSTTGVLTLVGVGVDGEAVTETQDISTAKAGLTTVTTYAYRSLTSATPTTLTGAAGTVKIDPAAPVALPTNKTPVATSFIAASVFGENCDGTNEAVGTVDTVARTVTLTTPPNATHNYTIDYTFTVVPVSPAHTHSLA